MTQTVYGARVVVHPSDAIEFRGRTRAGQEIVLHPSAESVGLLRQTFALESMAGYLGHAFWHVKEGRASPCSLCHGISPAPTLVDLLLPFVAHGALPSLDLLGRCVVRVTPEQYQAALDAVNAGKGE